MRRNVKPNITETGDRSATVDKVGMDADAPNQHVATTDVFAAQKRALQALDRRGRLRQLLQRSGKDFSSNDYLGLSNSDALRQAVTRAFASDGLEIGSGGSRLLRGNHPQHEAVEAEAASFFGAETALFFSGGFSANAALIATLPQRADLIVFDELIHASAHDGMQQTKAETRKARHNDAESVAQIIRQWRQTGGTGTPWIVVESLYSMDGDTAPINDLAEIAETTGAVLVIDEAHATGVFGPDGRGLAAHLEGRPNVITLHTCGKALGVMGGLICGPSIVRDFLINRARPFIYATAPSPLICAAVRAALNLSRSSATWRESLAKRTEAADQAFLSHFGFKPSASQIKPVIIGRETDTVAVAAVLQEHGFDIRAIRPPTVPEGTARLRIAITNNVEISDINDMVACLKTTLDARGLTPHTTAATQTAGCH